MKSSMKFKIDSDLKGESAISRRSIKPCREEGSEKKPFYDDDNIGDEGFLASVHYGSKQHDYPAA